MRKPAPKPPISSTEAGREEWRKMQHMLVIEGNPLTADEAAMFEMFDREGWTNERCRAHILAMLKLSASPEAAE